MTESVVLVIIGWVLGVVTTIIERHFHRQERKSDRRREIYEADLRVISDAVYAISEAVTGTIMTKEPKVRADLIRQAHAMLLKSLHVAGAFADQELIKGVRGLLESYGAWLYAIDLDTGMPKAGKEEEYRKAAPPMQKAASKVLRRIREILEEV